MTTRRAQRRLWHDLWVFFYEGAATSWTLPPSHWLAFDEVESATLEFEVTGVGPGATKTSLKVQRTAAPSADEDLWADIVTTGGSGSMTLTRGQSVEGLVLGSGGGLGVDGWSFPLGRLRTELSAASFSAGEWAAIRVRAHVITN
ncbi:MAG: hypothetical protein H6747_05770 [Deltaproteobacteria bacterium]|nr:hypothetical protein [Deltaproteobacteria bacterium]